MGTSFLSLFFNIKKAYVQVKPLPPAYGLYACENDDHYGWPLTKVCVCSTDVAEQEQNKELAERYKANKDDFPVYKLFLQGHTDPIDYTGNKKSSDDIIRFIVAESGNSLCSQ